MTRRDNWFLYPEEFQLEPESDVPLWREPVLYLLAGLAFGWLWGTFG